MEVITRKQARALGLKRYYTGKPCKRGHVSERTANDWHCCECNRFENMKPEQLERQRARHRIENMTPEKQEQNRAYQRAYRRAPDRVDRERARHRAATMTTIQRQRRSERIKRNNQYRRALKLGSGGRLSPNIKQTLFKKQCGQCVYCRMDLTTVTPHLDHRMPLVLGGGNTDDNVQLLCPTCNTSKCDTHPDEYEARIGFVRAGAPSRSRATREPATQRRVGGCTA
jgi:5-methylcytosine-specific restriction endonuclease McrA